MGATIIGLVMGAEIFKFAAPLAMANHVENSQTTRFVSTLGVWLLVVVFSFTNTFGNALMRHATEQASLDMQRDSATRPEHVILKEIAAIPACNKRTGKNCDESFAARKKALQAEIAATRKNANKPQQAVAKGDPIRDGMIQLAGMMGFELPHAKVFVLVTLIWTLLAEVGSSLGALAIPMGKREKEKA